MIGQFLAQGPYLPLLELQARWIVATWTGNVPAPDEARMRRVMAEGRPPLEAHNALATILADELGVSPGLLARLGLEPVADVLRRGGQFPWLSRRGGATSGDAVRRRGRRARRPR